MIARKSDCDLEQLSAVLLSPLDETTYSERHSAVTQHLDHCSYCRQQLEQLAADQRWWDDARQTLCDLQSDPTTAFSTTPANHAPPSSHSPDDASREPHWVRGLLQRSDDPRALGDIDGMSVESVVGQGGMGVVLKARDSSLQRFLAIKLLSPMLAGSGAARQRFFREARAAAAVVHPNIVPIYAVSAERSLPYLVMPYVAGGNLQHVLDADGPVALERSLSIGLQVAEGLAAAHRQGIVHRDIKPANLMLDEGGFRILITDFGLARALDDATLTGSGLLAGTPQYMSPEQARGAAIDHRSDIYSLGAVLYAMATARPPVRGDSTLELLRRIGEESPKSIVEINETYPLWYERLVQLLMAPQVDQRPQSAEQVTELLRGALAHARSPHQVPLPVQLRSATGGRFELPTIASAIGFLLAILALIVGAWLMVSPQPHRSPKAAAQKQHKQDALSIESEVIALPDILMTEDWESVLLEQLLLSNEQELGRLRQELGNEPSTE